MNCFTARPISLSFARPMSPPRPTAGMDRALLESNPSGPDDAINSQDGNRTPGKGRFPRSHSPGPCQSLSQILLAFPCSLTSQIRMAAQANRDFKIFFQQLSASNATMPPNRLKGQGDGGTCQSRLPPGRRPKAIAVVWRLSNSPSTRKTSSPIIP